MSPAPDRGIGSIAAAGQPCIPCCVQVRIGFSTRSDPRIVRDAGRLYMIRTALHRVQWPNPAALLTNAHRAGEGLMLGYRLTGHASCRVAINRHDDALFWALLCLDDRAKNALRS